MIRFPYVNWTEYWPVHNALFKDLFLKTRKYYDKHYYRKFVGLEQDMQSLAGRRRPFGTPLPTRPCIIRVTFTQWLNSFITRLTRWYLWKSFYPKYKSLWISCWSRCLYLLFKERVNAASLKPSLPVSWTKIQLSRIEIPGGNVFSANSILIGPRSTDELRGKRTPDSCSPHRITPRSIITPHSYCPCRQCSFDPVKNTHTHTHTQTFFRKTLLSVEGTRLMFRSISFLK